MRFSTRIGQAVLVPAYRLSILIVALMVLMPGCSDHDRRGPQFVTLRGTVEGAGLAQPGYTVSLYASNVGKLPSDAVIGTATTDGTGQFEIRYQLPFDTLLLRQPVLFAIAENGPIMLASVIGSGSRIPKRVVLNERTTVATGFAFAQFIHGRKIRGNTYGMLNAVRMAENMANPLTGAVGEVIARIPNGIETSTYPTFNSLANVVASCVGSGANCYSLFAATTPAGEPAPDTVLQAIANIAKYPSYPNYPSPADDPLFQLSLVDPVYHPALTQRPTNWLLFLKFTGGFYSAQDSSNLINGPGNIAFDERGFAWVLNNYTPAATLEIACTGQRLLKFYPWGEPFPGSPYFGGGLSGPGFGITFDPRGELWIGNYGFEAPACAAGGSVPPDPSNKIPATHNSLSLFHTSGVPLSPASGFTDGKLWWPQGTVSDREGNIWVANCGNDTITYIPKGNPFQAQNIPLPGAGTAEEPLLKPFAIAIDPDGKAWVTGNKSSEVYVISPEGVVETKDSSSVALSWPMGISGDSKGNMWVSNSDAVNVPCVDPFDPMGGGNPSVVFYPADGGAPLQIVKKGGLTVPWGNAIDGNDSLWVFNFGLTPLEDVEDGFEWPETGLSHFCGTGKCPAGLTVGDPISPDTGYTSDALERITGGGVDPSGNIWLLNNWKKIAPIVYDTNPGGNSIVIIPGAGAPVKPPLIGPPKFYKTQNH